MYLKIITILLSETWNERSAEYVDNLKNDNIPKPFCNLKLCQTKEQINLVSKLIEFNISPSLALVQNSHICTL